MYTVLETRITEIAANSEQEAKAKFDKSDFDDGYFVDVQEVEITNIKEVE